MSSIEAALEAIESLDVGEKINYSKIAREFGCSNVTLARRHKRVSTSPSIRYGNRQALHPQQEQELTQYIKGLCAQGLPPTRALIRNFGSTIAKRRLGKNWIDRFVKRHQMELITRWSTGIDRSRHIADSISKYDLYFKLLGRKLKEYNIVPQNIYNMDEKGFLLGVVTRSKRIFSKRMYEAGKLRSILQDGNREWVTVLACICADGSDLEPSLIYQSDSGNLQDTWLQAFEPDIHRIRFSASPSGWTNNEIGLAWLKDVFDRNTRAKARHSWRLLIVDGHGSHVSMEFIEYCSAHKILLFIYPPHSTHTLQGLDVVMFKPLSSKYSDGISTFMENCQGLTSMSKRDFLPLFIEAYTSTFIETTILKAFKATGISPFDPSIVLEKLRLRQPTSDSESSLSDSNWRKTERLLREVVRDRDDPRAQQLSQIFHTISVRKELLQYEVTGLRKALANEKLHRNRGKALPLPKPDGGSTCWSPRAIRVARNDLRLKALEEEQLQLQKDERERLRIETRKAKAAAAQQRREARAEARVLREQRKAAKAEDVAARKAARETAKRLKEALKLSEKGNKQSLKPAAKPRTKRSKKHVVIEDGGGEVLARAQLPIVSRRGRTIRKPSKYID